MDVSVNWLPETAYFYMLVFARTGTMMMLMPAIGERMITARMRLAFALMFALVVFPLVTDTLPALGGNFWEIVAMMGHEIAVGLILGGIARLALLATQVAGATIAFQAGLSVAQAADPTQGGIQGALVGSFLSLLGITLIFATDLHHVVLAAVYESYVVFPPSLPLAFGDAATMAIRAVAGAFTIGIQMAAPFIVLGLVFYLGVGLLGRLMPQIQVFFMAMPATIGVGLLLLALLLTTMMGWYLMHVENELAMLRGN